MTIETHVAKPLGQDCHLQSLSAEYHQESSFREQMGVLYIARMTATHVTLLRTFLAIGEPGVVSLDPDNPGMDTPEAFHQLDYRIEKHRCVGTFHTHPPFVFEFSQQDVTSQNGLAKSNGSKLLWHGVQACSTRGVGVNGSYFVCCQMLGDKVFRYHYGHIDDRLGNPVIVLPLPPEIEWNGSVYDLSIACDLSTSPT